MVDVSLKTDSERVAVARADVIMNTETLELINQGMINKGDVLTVAELAGVMAAKRTAELIPLCHPLQVNYIDVKCEKSPELPGIKIMATVRTVGKTGVEMEALTAVSVAALTVYDMAKSVDKTMCIKNIRLIEKRGGQSGEFVNRDVLPGEAQP